MSSTLPSAEPRPSPRAAAAALALANAAIAIAACTSTTAADHPAPTSTASPVPACDRGWSGPTCATLVTHPAPPNGGLRDPALSFWDGSAIFGDDGRYHLFASRFAHACGLDTWQTNSECVRAASDAPLGPYAVEAVVAGAFCHNPTVRRAPNGGFVLFSIGAPVADAKPTTDCNGGVTLDAGASGLDPDTCIISVRTAPSVLGPWSPPTQLAYRQPIPICPTNPAPIIAADGSVRLYFRAYDLSGGSGPVERLYLAEAPSVTGTYVMASPHALLALEAEDPFAWPRLDGRGVQLLFNDKFTEPTQVGGHAVSTEGISWTATAPAYGLTIDYDDGTSATAARRERPQVLWIDATRGVLFTAVEPSAADDRSFTSAVPIGDWP